MRYLFVILSTVIGLRASAQQDGLTSIKQQFDQYNRQHIQEKLFVHVDRPVYMVGETMWFKLYYVDGTFHRPFDLSKVAYFEVLDGEQRSVLQAKVGLTSGKGDGALFLPASLASGNYVVRAYTNWMKNAGAGYFFEKPVTIINPFRKLGLPVLAKNAGYDVQLFPEGGNLVQGLPSRVGFRVTDASGRGIAFQGAVVNGSDTVARFQPDRFGIGSFGFTPAAGSSYRVVVKDAQGRTSSHAFPAVYPQGYAMQVEETGSGQLTVRVRTNAADASVVYLLGHTRQQAKLAEMRPIQQEATFVISKEALGEGVSHLTIFDAARKPVCERLYFRRPSTALAIQTKTDKEQYAARTKVALSLGTPQAADLSVAVYRVDSIPALSSADMQAYLAMVSDLHGAVEEPSYYLQPESPAVNKAVDNLMLTHGWRRFKWEEVLSGKQTGAYLPEIHGLIVEGKLTDPRTNKPVAGHGAFLSTPGKPIRLFTSRSDSTGRLVFETKDFYGPRTIMAQPAEAADSLLKVTIDSPFPAWPALTRLPVAAIDQSHTGALENRSVAMQVQATYWNERMIRYRLPQVDSTAFYGKPTESYLLDAYTRFPAMEEVLREYVPGVAPRKRQGKFRLMVLNLPYKEFFEEPSLVMVDGVPVQDMDKLMAYSPLKVKQLDVVTNRYFLGPNMFSGIVSFITYKGDLSGYPLDERLLKQEYDGLQIPREFYAPRYETQAQQTTRMPDARTLLYWNPSVTVNREGQIDFFTSDQDGRYLIEVHGLSANGQAGTQRAWFEVKGLVK
ncbi:hypothetical protein [Arsenicibacter rosenii]|uniref:Macroglobulin domain-containing protein n=1 Tax=Arsenicibacter rosenii TaxID=1750698 RepID=A0A1S2VFN7_9BACT|nr:hypothetical protein [Arsenicibacter rosenii]OIN57543.1 hypothetical protein BLX24_18815 [Arsenicibacter rosenii]